MASVKLAYMPQPENNRVFAQYSPVEPASRSNSAVGSGIWSSAPPATPQPSGSSFIGSAWSSPLTMPTPSNTAAYVSAPPAASAGASNAFQSGPKLLADLTVGSEPVPDTTSPEPAAISAYPSTQSLSSSGSRFSSRQNSSSEPRSTLVPSPTAVSSALVAPSASSAAPGLSGGNSSDEIINTAIVVKNIPFAIKKEQLIDFMTQLGLPLPYAFNYHFDNGVFRGLAFANFTTADETAAVISTLNGRELGGRRLRVEYKKMLPFQERERIEREKRERRGQLEEQHQQGPNANASSSIAGSSSNVPATPPLAHSHASTHHHAQAHVPSGGLGAQAGAQVSKADMNDAETLQMYSSLLVFKYDLSRAELIIPSAVASGLTVSQTYTLGLLCRQLDLQSLTTEEQNIVISRNGDVDTLYKSESGGDVPPYLSGVLGAAVTTSATPTLSRVNPAVIGTTQNITALSAMNRWNSVGNLSGLTGVGGGVGMMPQSWAAGPGNASGAPSVGSGDSGSRNKFYETAFHHGASSGVDRRH